MDHAKVKRPTTSEPTTTISISIPVRIVDRVKLLAHEEYRNVSAMCAVLLTDALQAREKKA